MGGCRVPNLPPPQLSFSSMSNFSADGLMGLKLRFQPTLRGP